MDIGRITQLTTGPVAEITRDMEIKTTWGVLDDYRRQSAEAQAEIERLQEAKRRALAVADERAKEAVELRAENERLRESLQDAEFFLTDPDIASIEDRKENALMCVRLALGGSHQQTRNTEK